LIGERKRTTPIARQPSFKWLFMSYMPSPRDDRAMTTLATCSVNIPIY
jgi:hypothetical protein